ncbi:hypothetical protein Tco_1034010, partial [Tanacetum coccineum]
ADKNVVVDKVDVAKDVVQDDPAKVVKESVEKDKPKGSASSVVVNKDNREGVNDKVLGVVAKDKPKGSVSFVVVRKDNRKENSKKEFLISCHSDSLFLLSKDERRMDTYVEKLKILLDEVKADMLNPASRNTGDVIGGILSISKPNQVDVKNPTKENI